MIQSDHDTTAMTCLLRYVRRQFKQGNKDTRFESDEQDIKLQAIAQNIRFVNIFSIHFPFNRILGDATMDDN